MRMPAKVLLVAALVVGAAAFAGWFGSSSTGGFKTILQSPDGSYPLPVVVRDETGLVTGTVASSADPTLDYFGPAVRADPSDPNAFIVSWLGGACDNDAVLWFTRGDGAYSLSIEVHGKFGFGGCPALGVPRDVRIVTSKPVPLASIVAAGGS